MERSLVVMAHTIAQVAHRGQTDKAGKPYFGHVARVWGVLQDGGFDEEIQIAGLLHDIVEDTPWTLIDVARAFGERVAKVVNLCTRPEGSTYAEFIERLIGGLSPAAQVVKIADLMDNTDPRRGSAGSKMKRRYGRALVDLTDALERRLESGWCKGFEVPTSRLLGLARYRMVYLGLEAAL